MRHALTLVQAPMGDRMKGEEFDAGFRDKPIILADTRDGKPLPAGAGPFQRAVGDEFRGARSVRMITKITVTKGTK